MGLAESNVTAGRYLASLTLVPGQGLIGIVNLRHLIGILNV